MVPIALPLLLEAAMEYEVAISANYLKKYHSIDLQQIHSHQNCHQFDFGNAVGEQVADATDQEYNYIFFAYQLVAILDLVLK